MHVSLKVLLVFALAILFCCKGNKSVECKYGLEYNRTRTQFAVPLIDASMQAEGCSDSWSIFISKVIPTDTFPFHASKTVWKVDNGKVIKEVDTYRKVISDTVLLQLDVSSIYDWTSKTATLKGTIGSADKQSIYPKIGNNVQEQLKYPDFEVQELTEQQVDSLLNLWNLPRRRG